MNVIKPPPPITVGDIRDASSVVTSFMVAPSLMDLLPDWLRTMIPPLTELEALPAPQARIYKSTGLLGSTDYPLEQTLIPRLAHELSEHDLAPTGLNMYLRRVRGNIPVYRVNIHWSRDRVIPEAANAWDSDQLRELFTTLQVQVWDIDVSQFLDEKNTIVVNLRNRKIRSSLSNYKELHLRENFFQRPP